MTADPGNGAATLAPSDFAAAFAIMNALKGPILLAVSGGADSTALMHAAARWASARSGPPLVVATVDHGLRPGSCAEAEAVGREAASIGLPHRLLAWTDARSLRPSQQAARRARYGLLGALAGEIGAAALVTAHTIDDQAETILMRLAAGSGLAGLAGMRIAGRLGSLPHLRPFLPFTKDALVATCRAHGWSFAEDPSNADPRYARVRWRGLLPSLKAEGLDPACLARFARRALRTDEALQAVAAAAAERSRVGDGQALDFRTLAAEPDEVVIRVLTAALTPSGSGKALRLERVESCAEALQEACAAARPLRRTLAGHILSLDAQGVLTIGTEAPRRRGRPHAVTLHVVESPHSLGTGASRA